MGDAHVSATQWYAKYGAAPRAENDPADHVGLLLTFYARLMAAGTDADELRRFADRHLSWVPGFADEVSATARHDFYRMFGDWLASGVREHLRE